MVSNSRQMAHQLTFPQMRDVMLKYEGLKPDALPEAGTEDGTLLRLTVRVFQICKKKDRAFSDVSKVIAWRIPFSEDLHLQIEFNGRKA